MASVINTNLQSLNSQRNMATSQASLATSMQRLSSGLRVNSAKDDAAGLAIADRMTTKIRGMNVAIRNANDGVSLAQTAEGGLGTISENLQRMRELAVQAKNGSNTSADRANLNKEFVQLKAEIDRTIQGADFNGKKILNGDASSITFQVGADVGSNNEIAVQIENMTNASAMTSVQAASIGGADGTAAEDAISKIDTALNKVNDTRADLGAIQNRFSSVITNLQVSVENQTAAKSRIMDADFAAETANLSRSQILQQAGTAMIAQANQAPQNVLSLLR